MRHTFTTFGLVLLGAFMLIETVSAAPNTGTTTPEREAGRCRAAHRLCMDVAEIDYNDCMGLFDDFGKCVGEWLEDVGICLDDLNDCLDRAGVASSLPSGQMMMPDNPQEVAPSEETSPYQGTVPSTSFFLAPRSFR